MTEKEGTLSESPQKPEPVDVLQKAQQQYSQYVELAQLASKFGTEDVPAVWTYNWSHPLTLVIKS